MSTVRVWLVPKVSILAARWTQFVAGRRLLSRILAPIMRSRLATRTGRWRVGSAAHIADRYRPIHFPQQGRRNGLLAHLPRPDTTEFEQLALSARRRREVTLAPEALDAIWASEAIVALGAAGVPLRWAGPRCQLPPDLGRELSDALVHPPVHDLHDRELRSIRIRRSALDALDGRSGTVTPTNVSVLLASKRPADVERAVEFVANQRGVIPQLLVGLHGPAWTDDDARRIERLAPPDTTVRHFDAEQNLGDVLGSLTDEARHDLVVKWDDDDWYGPDHLADLVRAYRYSGADVVGKAAEFVYLEQSDMTIRRFAFGAESYSWTLAGGALLTSTSWIERIGGWQSVARGVDRELLATTRRIGGSAYRTHGFQYVLRRRAGGAHTWSVPDSLFRAVAMAHRRGLDLAFADVAGAPS